MSPGNASAGGKPFLLQDSAGISMDLKHNEKHVLRKPYFIAYE